MNESVTTKPDIAHAVDQTIRERKTAKLLRDPAAQPEAPLSDEHRAELKAMIETAGWAPFHKLVDASHRQDELTSIVPWRFYVLERDAGYRLNTFLAAQAERYPDSVWTRAWGSKIPKLIAAAGALVQVTWLPDPPAGGREPDLTVNNIEHIAAASAAAQNLLLSAQARGWYSYWSSGGILRDAELFAHLSIPQGEMLLGAIFLTPPGLPFDTNKAGGLREKRGEVTDWARWLALE